MKNLLSLQEEFQKVLSSFQVPSEPKELYEPITYTLSNGGKRMRPLLLLLGCKIFSDDISKALHPAVGIELFHNFTLLHDDIMDDAPIRRGQPSVHAQWNQNIAILSGDAMIIKAYQHLTETNSEILPLVLSEFNKTALEVCEGQQQDMNFEQREDVSIDEYLGMIKLKTAVLLAASLKIGAIIGGATHNAAEKLYNFGLNTGIAFQLQDDILDVFGESHKVGKQKGGDIISNKKTYLLLKALELAKGTHAASLNEWLASTNEAHKVEAVTAIYNDLGVRKLAEERMWNSYEKGVSNLDEIQGNSEWIETLKGFSHNLMHREH